MTIPTGQMGKLRQQTHPDQSTHFRKRSHEETLLSSQGVGLQANYQKSLEAMVLCELGMGVEHMGTTFTFHVAQLRCRHVVVVD